MVPRGKIEIELNDLFPLNDWLLLTSIFIYDMVSLLTRGFGEYSNGYREEDPRTTLNDGKSCSEKHLE